MIKASLPGWIASLPAHALEGGALAGALALDDPGRVLWVEQGALDLFLFRDGDGAAEQRPYARVEAGASAWCLPPAGGWRLRGVPLPGSRLLEVSREALLLADGGAVEEQIWSWLRTAYGFGVTEAFPKHVLPLKPGDEPVCEAGTALVPQARLLWLEMLSGTGKLAGTAEVRAPAVLGLADNAWLEAGDQMRASACTTADLAATGRLGPALDATLAQLAAGLAQRLHAADRLEWARLAARSEADRREVERAALEFRSILEPELLYDELDTSGDPLLAACRIAGRRQGIEFRPHPASLRGQPQRDPLGNIVSASGVRSRIVTLRAGWWNGDHGPLVARVAADRRPVALVPARVGGYRLHDPLRRKALRVDEAVAAQLEPVAHAFYRTLAARALGAFDLLRFATSGLSRDFLLIIAVGALGGLAGLAGPYLNQPLFDDAIPSADRLQVMQVVLALLGATIAATMFEVTRNLTVLRVEGVTDLSAQAGVWDRLLRLPVPFFRRYTAGDLTLRAGAVGAIRAAVAGTTVNSLLSAVFSLVSLALLFHFSPHLAWLTMGLVALLIVLMIPGTAFKLHFERGVADIAGRLSGLVFQLLGGIAKLRVSAAEPRAFALWARQYGGQERLVLRANLADAWLQVVLGAFPIAASLVLFLAVASQSAAAGALTTGTFLGFNAAFGSFLGGMLGVFSAVVGALQALPLYERLKPILEAETEVAEGRADPGLISGRIELSSVSFRYSEDSPWVLREVSLQIRPGEFVAIVGGSGAGKSTLLRLLLGFERSTSGTVFFDGQDLSGLDIGAVRRQMGVVLQHSQLLAGDIYTNVAGAAPLSIKDVTDALRACGMEEDIAAMPMGVHTVLPEGGVTLSGGQRQRLLLARAVATRPRVLLLDEATSALDNRSQATVTTSLRSLKATRIVIAHRLSTVMNADRIYVLDAGRVVQVGTYAELMAQEGPFRQLASRQTA